MSRITSCALRWLRRLDWFAHIFFSGRTGPIIDHLLLLRLDHWFSIARWVGSLMSWWFWFFLKKQMHLLLFRLHHFLFKRRFWLCWRLLDSRSRNLCHGFSFRRPVHLMRWKLTFFFWLSELIYNRLIDIAWFFWNIRHRLRNVSRTWWYFWNVILIDTLIDIAVATGLRSRRIIFVTLLSDYLSGSWWGLRLYLVIRARNIWKFRFWQVVF